jgi:hypothetical protein
MRQGYSAEVMPRGPSERTRVERKMCKPWTHTPTHSLHVRAHTQTPTHTHINTLRAHTHTHTHRERERGREAEIQTDTERGFEEGADVP